MALPKVCVPEDGVFPEKRLICGQLFSSFRAEIF
jgi:hypothetical protein